MEGFPLSVSSNSPLDRGRGGESTIKLSRAKRIRRIRSDSFLLEEQKSRHYFIKLKTPVTTKKAAINDCNTIRNQ